MSATLTSPFVMNPSQEKFSYEEAFSRNLGLISPTEQEMLRNSCVAIPGMGGVGGIHFMTLVRLGIGSFRIADPDAFEVANFNRQYGADMGTVGRNKAEVMAEKAQAVNPELDVAVFRDPIDERNVGEFLDGADVVVDGIDYFALSARRLLFREARKRGLWVVTAGPIGFSTAWLVFDPNGMSFDEYFDVHDGMEPLDQFTAFTVGIAPDGTQWDYFDLSQLDRGAGRGPAVSLACQLAAGVASAEVIKILLGRTPINSVPHYAQFDAYSGRFSQGRIPLGNRSPQQRRERSRLHGQMAGLGR